MVAGSLPLAEAKMLAILGSTLESRKYTAPMPTQVMTPG